MSILANIFRWLSSVGGGGGGVAFGACFGGGAGVGGAGGAWVRRGSFVFVVVRVLFGIAGNWHMEGKLDIILALLVNL